MPISQITGASIQDGSIVVADLGITTFNTGTGNTLTLQANSATGLVISVTGNTAIANSLSFSSTGARITGDFSNATFTNRVAFQTSTTNGNSIINALPNGTATQSGYVAYNNSDPTNAARAQLQANASEVQFVSGISGTGTYLPMTMYTGGSERLRIDTSGNVGIGTSNPSSYGKFSVENPTTCTITAAATGTGVVSTVMASNNPVGIGIAGTSSNHPYIAITNGTERMRIDASGNLGINTTSPSQKLHVAAGNILVSNTSSQSATVAIAGNGSAVGTSAFELIQGASSEAYVYNRANSFLVLGTNNTERMRIDSNGNVGIGTSSPAALFHVNGASRAVSASLNGVAIGDYTLYQGLVARVGNGNGIGINSANSTDNAYIYFGYGTTSGAMQGAAIGRIGGDVLSLFTSGTERMRIDSSGRVLIGTTTATTPSSGASGGYLLEVTKNQNAFTEILVKNTDINSAGQANYVAISDTVTTRFGSAGSGDAYQTGSSGFVSVDGAYPLTFRTNSSERMRIDSSGNVGIGTPSPNASYRLDVAGNQGIRVFGGTVGSVAIRSTQTYSTFINFTENNVADRGVIGFAGGNSGMQFRVNGAYDMSTGTEAMRIDSAGRVTMPFQPAFTASKTNGNTGTSGTIIYNSANINVGGYYNTSNGRFTAPVAGIYMFSITGISLNTAYVEATIQVNGSGTYLNARGGSNANSTQAGYCGVILISLAVNDYVTVIVEAGVAQYGFGNYTTFSGRLMQ